MFIIVTNYRPEVKEGKEVETEKKAEQENNESDKIEKELEKDKVKTLAFSSLFTRIEILKKM